VVPPTGNVADVVDTFSNYMETVIKLPWRSASTKKSGAKVLITQFTKGKNVFFAAINKLRNI
jgi:isoleucyl-tRNA synthetase